MGKFINQKPNYSLDLLKGAKGPQGNYDFTIKIKGRSNTAFCRPHHMKRQELGFDWGQ